MSPRKASITLIVISILAAGAILFSSFLMAGSESSQMVTFLIIAVWFVPFWRLTQLARNKKPDAENADAE